MGSASDNYVLKWNEFHTCVATSFMDLRNAQEFLDVTVAVDQHHQLQAHKVILSKRFLFHFNNILKAIIFDTIKKTLLPMKENAIKNTRS